MDPNSGAATGRESNRPLRAGGNTAFDDVEGVKQFRYRVAPLLLFDNAALPRIVNGARFFDWATGTGVYGRRPGGRRGRSR